MKLPGLKQANQAQLSLAPQQLTVSVAGMYYLQLELPYTVADAEGRASFNPAKQQLEVTLPVVPPKVSATAPVQSESQQQQDSQTVSAESGIEQSRNGRQQSASTGAASRSTGNDDFVTQAQNELEQRPDNSTQPAEASGHARCTEPAAGAAAVQGSSDHTHTEQQPLLTDNQRRWLELHQPTGSAAAVDCAQAEPAEEAVDTNAIQQAADAGNAAACF